MVQYTVKHGGRFDHTRPNSSTVLAECEYRRISKKAIFNRPNHSKKPVSLYTPYIHGKPKENDAVNSLYGVGDIVGAKLRGVLLRFYQNFIEEKEGKEKVLSGKQNIQRLLALEFISQSPRQDFKEDYVITKKGHDYMKRLMKREKVGEFVPTNWTN